jgi:DNA-binding XRE family transcriptional regulator
MLDKQRFDDWAIGLKPRRGRPRKDAESPPSLRRAAPASPRGWNGVAVPDGSTYEFSPTRLVRIRHRTRLSQAQFAQLLNVSVRTVQNWEQGRRRPTGPAVSLIRIVDRDAPLALRALRIPVPSLP